MRKTASQGFTLLELMIVAAIISIVATIALSSYSDSVMRSKRTDARTTLATTATALEKCKATYGVYDSANCNVLAQFPIESPDGNYSIQNTVINPVDFTLTAFPVPGTSQESDTDCTSLILNHLGQQTATGATPDDCW
ncbi:MAG: type IV pilin protein [Gammaproteobacteria bacterium]|nr:type IV pilin protein [Gammaproteobacteria bacterium]